MNNITVLLIEDETLLTEQLKEYFEIFFENVYVANNAEDGYTQYKKISPNIIVTDINMPGMNGLELVKKIRATNKDIEIIILSAHTNNEYLAMAQQLDITHYLKKPIKSDDIRNILIDVEKKIKQNL